MSLARPLVDPSERPGFTRNAIAVALGEIDGIHGYPHAPDQATAGAGWPRWIQTTYDGPLCTLANSQYDVLVTLPADYADYTIDEGDGFRDVVALKLIRLGRVAYAEPVNIAFQDRQTMPGLRFRLEI